MRDIDVMSRLDETVPYDMGDLDGLIARLEAEEFRRAETARISSSQLRAEAEADYNARLESYHDYMTDQEALRGFDELEWYVRSGQLDTLSFSYGADEVSEKLHLGEWVGGGSFNEVIRDASDGSHSQVFRISKYVDGADILDIERRGRAGAEAAAQARPKDLIVPTIHKQYTNIKSRDARLNGKTIQVVDNIPEQPAEDLIAANGGQLTPRQADAYRRGVRALNEQGYVLADAHPGNYTFRAQEDSDELTMVIIDPGAIIRARDGSASSARAAQDMIDNPPDEFAARWGVFHETHELRWPKKKEVLMKEGLEDLLDLDGLGLDYGDLLPIAPQGAELFPNARELLRLSPDDAARRLQEMLDEIQGADTGTRPPRESHEDSTVVPFERKMPAESLQADQTALLAA